MTYFNENEPYWGNTTLPVIGSVSDRLSVRSVKIFADGVPWFTFKLQKTFSQCCRGSQDRRRSGRACIASPKHLLIMTHMMCSCTNPTATIPPRTASCASMRRSCLTLFPSFCEMVGKWYGLLFLSRYLLCAYIC